MVHRTLGRLYQIELKLGRRHLGNMEIQDGGKASHLEYISQTICWIGLKLGGIHQVYFEIAELLKICLKYDLNCL